MGIYSNGHIYGVSFILDGSTIFEKIYDTKLAYNQVQSVKEFYDKLNTDKKDMVVIRFYMSCVSTYEPSQPGECMCWWPVHKDELEKLFETMV